jgi:Tfp pilus assembly protein PilX
MRNEKTSSSVRRGRKGIALLLVMIALVVGTTLSTGFILTQGTSIGIARNQRDYDSARSVAESGIDMCVWMIKNQSNWRTAMTPGTWINNLSISNGSVTVTAVDGANNSAFSVDYTQSVVLTSVGTVNGRTYTVSATVTPSAGGTPFANGGFIRQSTQLQASTQVDSYNTAVGPYWTSKGQNAVIGTASNSSGSLSMDSNSKFYGSYVGGPTGALATLVNIVNAPVTAPSSVSDAAFARNLGTVVLPNMNGFTNGLSFSKSLSYSSSTNNVYYSSFAISGWGTVVTFPVSSQVIHVTGNASIASNSTLKVPDGDHLTLVVDGSFTNNGTIDLSNTGTLTVYVNGNVQFGSSSYTNQSGTPSAFVIVGTNSSSGNITVSGSVSCYGAIYAPNATVDIQGSSLWYGSIIAQQLLLENGAMLHLDDALKTYAFHNLTGGTTMGDYSVVWKE